MQYLDKFIFVNLHNDVRITCTHTSSDINCFYMLGILHLLIILNIAFVVVSSCVPTVLQKPRTRSV